MVKSQKNGAARAKDSTAAFERIGRPVSLVAQVEHVLRQAIAENRFPDGKLPSEVELAEQLGVGRETVRQAAEFLQREGLLFKVRRRGTFTKPPRVPGQIRAVDSKLLGYLQADFVDSHGQEEVANRAISGLMLQGALAEAGKAEYKLEVHHTPYTRWKESVRGLGENTRLRGVVLASYSDDKILRRLTARDLPTVLIDEDTNVPKISSVRDDCFEGARQAVIYLAGLGHRRIAYAHWQKGDLNRWRPMGYQRGLKDAGLPHRNQMEILTELTVAGARKLIDQFLGLANRPTALYCFNNTLANYAIAEIRRRGLRVPEDFSVMGAGGEETPGLSCHQVDWYQMGRTAIQILLRMLADPENHEAEHHLSPHSMRVGQDRKSVV